MVERLTLNQKVAGSTPAWASNQYLQRQQFECIIHQKENVMSLFNRNDTAPFWCLFPKHRIARDKLNKTLDETSELRPLIRKWVDEYHSEASMVIREFTEFLETKPSALECSNMINEGNAIRLKDQNPKYPFPQLRELTMDSRSYIKKTEIVDVSRRQDRGTLLSFYIRYIRNDYVYDHPGSLSHASIPDMVYSWLRYNHKDAANSALNGLFKSKIYKSFSRDNSIKYDTYQRNNLAHYRYVHDGREIDWFEDRDCSMFIRYVIDYFLEPHEDTVFINMWNSKLNSDYKMTTWRIESMFGWHVDVTCLDKDKSSIKNAIKSRTGGDVSVVD